MQRAQMLKQSEGDPSVAKSINHKKVEIRKNIIAKAEEIQKVVGL
jgi:hypothetical protein